MKRLRLMDRLRRQNRHYSLKMSEGWLKRQLPAAWPWPWLLIIGQTMNFMHQQEISLKRGLIEIALLLVIAVNTVLVLTGIGHMAECSPSVSVAKK